MNLTFLDGTYIYENFVTGMFQMNEQWCFPDFYVGSECIDVTCNPQDMTCNFGHIQSVPIFYLISPHSNNIDIKIRLEPDFFNFSVGDSHQYVAVYPFTQSKCDMTDGTPAVCSAGDAVLTITDQVTVTVKTISLDHPTCTQTVSNPPLTPAPTPPPAAGARGDPHCTNLRGENFEVYKRGKLNMVTIPQGRDPAEADFSIMVVVTPTWWKKCAASFISLAVIMRESSCEKITIRPGDGRMPQVERLPNAERTCNQTSTLEEIGEKTLLLKAGERKVKFWQTTKYDKYLNIEVYNLAGEKQKVGGILGLDEHGDEAEIPEECKGAKHHLHLEAYHAVTSISFARVI